MAEENNIRVLLVDDQQLMLEGLRTLMEVAEGIDIVGEASNGEVAIHLYEQLTPDVVLMDVQMPKMDGVEATRRICNKWSDARIIILTTFNDDDYVFEGIRAGAVGYILKAIRGAELAEAIRTVAGGGSLLEPSVARKVLTEFARQSTSPVTDPKQTNMSLTERETSVLALIAEGASNREIAQKLFLAEGTVKNYVTLILQKLDVRDRTQAALLARDLGLL